MDLCNKSCSSIPPAWQKLKRWIILHADFPTKYFHTCHVADDIDLCQWTTTGTADLPLSSVSRPVVCQTFFDGIHYWPWIICSWGKCNGQTCFSLLDAVSSELLTTAPAHVDKHMWPERLVIVCASFVVYYVRSVVFGYWRLSKPGWFLRKKALKHSKEYFVNGCLK